MIDIRSSRILDGMELLKYGWVDDQQIAVENWFHVVLSGW